MLLHIIFDWSGLISNSKRFKNHLENRIEKMKRKFYSFSFTSFLFGLLAHFCVGPRASYPLSSPRSSGPARVGGRNRRCHLPALPP
jgi:hypothetical protein